MTCRWRNRPEGCRRAGPRTSDLRLTSAERDWLRECLARVQLCGKVAISRRQLRLEDSGPVETRWTTMAECGLRWCRKCEDRARRYRAERAVGPHGLMVTLTLDAPRCSKRRAWRAMTGWVGAFIRAVRRLWEEDNTGLIRRHWQARHEADRWRRELTDRQRPVPDVSCVWAIEPHESGYPHAHLLFGLAWLDADWCRPTWQRITGMPRVSPELTLMKSKVKGSRYLTKYITKASFPADLCAVSRGKRLFWSSIPLPWEPPKGWHAVDRGGHEAAALVLAGDRKGPTGHQWRDVTEPAPTFRLQERAWPVRPAAVADDWRAIYRPPLDWDGPAWQWSRMVRDAVERKTGRWQWRGMHDARRHRWREALWFILETIACALAWRWQPGQPGCVFERLYTERGRSALALELKIDRLRRRPLPDFGRTAAGRDIADRGARRAARARWTPPAGDWVRVYYDPDPASGDV